MLFPVSKNNLKNCVKFGVQQLMIKDATHGSAVVDKSSDAERIVEEDEA